MAMRKYTNFVTATTTTASMTIAAVRGKIHTISIKPSGTSTDFKATYTKAGITNYMIGGAASTVTIAAAGQICYPIEERCLADGVDLTSSDVANYLAQHVLVNDDITITITNIADTETVTVEIIAEE